MENNNHNNNQEQCSTQSMIIGIGSIVAGFLLVLMAYQTMLHVIYCAAGALLVLFGLIKLRIIRSAQDFLSKMSCCMRTCCEKIKSLMGCGKNKNN